MWRDTTSSKEKGRKTRGKRIQEYFSVVCLPVKVRRNVSPVELAHQGCPGGKKELLVPPKLSKKKG